VHVTATAYVVNEDSGTVTPIDTATRRALKAIRVGSYPDAIAITPDGKTAYAANDNSVSRIDIPSGTPARQIKPVSAGHGPAAIAISPDGTTVYVSALFESDSTAESDMPGPMTPIQTATGRPRKPLKPDNNPQAIAISPDGRIAYVANWQSCGTVTPVNLVTGAPEKPIKAGNHPIAITVGPGELSG
jgi:hyaluronoglucosaminidase